MMFLKYTYLSQIDHRDQHSCLRTVFLQGRAQPEGLQNSHFWEEESPHRDKQCCIKTLPLPTYQQHSPLPSCLSLVWNQTPPFLFCYSFLWLRWKVRTLVEETASCRGRMFGLREVLGLSSLEWRRWVAYKQATDWPQTLKQSSPVFYCPFLVFAHSHHHTFHFLHHLHASCLLPRNLLWHYHTQLGTLIGTAYSSSTDTL